MMFYTNTVEEVRKNNGQKRELKSLNINFVI